MIHHRGTENAEKNISFTQSASGSERRRQLDKTTIPAMEWLMIFDLLSSPGKSKYYILCALRASVVIYFFSVSSVPLG
jgi:hypothetical protein